MRTPETDALRDLYENHEHHANVGDIWDLCESLERRLADVKRLERERNETANTFMGQVKKLQAQLAVMREALEFVSKNCQPYGPFWYGGEIQTKVRESLTLTAPKQ